MYKPKCPHCQGTGMTPFRQNGGKCYTCGGSRVVTPADIHRQGMRQGYPIVLENGRRVSDLLLADAGDHLEWVDPDWARRTGVTVLVPAPMLDNWEKATVAQDGRSIEAPPF